VAVVEDGLAELDGNQESLFLSHDQLAHFSDLAARQVGLPAAAPYRLRIQGEGILSQPGFRFQWQLVRTDGRPAMGVQRTGTFVRQGANHYLLLDPLYRLIQGMEAYNDLPPDDLDSRFLRWAELKELLPEDADVSDQLRTMHIARADTLSLDLKGTDDFDPVLLARDHPGEDAEDGEEVEPDPILPEAPQRDFAERFRELPRAHQRYALAGNWYVVVPEPVQKALQVVREVQESSPQERSAFIANPQGTLRERLGDELGSEELESLFHETPLFVSERVKYLGEWKPKARAFTVPSDQAWFPPEELILGVPTRNQFYQVEAKDLPEVVEQIQQAQEAGQPTIEYKGQTIQADEETLTAFQQVAPKAKQATKEEQAGEEAKQKVPESQEASGHLVPVIDDNLDVVGYQSQTRPATGKVGGLPAALGNVQLFPHQQQGLEWLQNHWVSGSPGGLLADDMGLGKTIQALAFMAWVQEQMDNGSHPQKPLLVVAPTGLLRNWEAEADKHLKGGGLGPLFRAYDQDLKQLKGKTSRERRNDLEQMGWVLTTYETLRDRYDYFLDIDWAVIVFDEVQKIKNPGTRGTDIAKSVGGDFGLALTGTPVENSLTELWCIVDAIHPGFLGAQKDFEARYEKPAQEDPEAARAVKDLLEAEQNGMPPKLLRRMKEDHLKGLPEKREHVLEETMPQAQAEAYKAVLATATANQGGKGSALEALQHMRKTSLIPGDLADTGLTDELVESSARLKEAVRVLDEIHARGEKALVFLEFLDIQAALLDYLQRRYEMPNPPQRISGQANATQRQSQVEAFQSSPPGEFQVMLLSPKAGGVGLTLTAANHVIHLSRWWNPAVEDQCTDRALRIGQDKEVHIYYPLAVHPEFGDHSFDLNLHRLLTKKRDLSRAVLAPVAFSKEDQAGLFEGTIQD
jgi:superfamily II DNA or RNA helicase